MIRVLLIAFVLALPFSVAGQAKRDVALSKRIDSLVVEDQKWRELMRHAMNGQVDSVDAQRIGQNIRRTDSLNQIEAKKIFQQAGFPGYDRVGEKSSFHFRLMVQHCDNDPAFQEQVLTKMKMEVERKNASAKEFAYLTDRVKTNQGKKQVYDTQMQLNAAQTSFEPKPVIDSTNLNQRRREVGLPPMEEYIKTMNANFSGELKSGS